VRPPVESYCRGTVTEGTIEAIVGIEMRDGAEFFDLLAASHQLMREAIASLSGSHTVASPPMLAWAIRNRIESLWPDRYWFLECASTDVRDGWCQIFSPPARKWSLVQEVA
jgi:hypothetical protein